MDKKKYIAIIAIVVMMAVLVIWVLATSNKGENVLSSNELLKIEDKIYTVEDCKNYIKIANEAEGDIAKVMTETEKQEAVDQFLREKTYAYAAEKHGITVPEEEIEKFKNDYSGEKLYAENGISQEAYLKNASENYLYTQLSQNIGEYYELPEEVYDSFLEGLEDPMKSYSFRMMTFYYEEPESGETSGDISGDKLRDAVYAKAEDIRNQVIDGGDFEKLAQENSSYRYTFNGSSYTLVNGNIEYVSSVLLKDKLGSEAIYNAVKDLESGECSEIVEDTESNVINFVKVETVEDGFVGKADEEIREILLNEYQENLVAGDMHYHLNQSALLKVYYQ